MLCVLSEYQCFMLAFVLFAVLYEPTAVQKACRVVTAGVHSLVKYATPNLAELVAIYKGIVHSGKIDIEDVHGTCCMYVCVVYKCLCVRVLVYWSAVLVCWGAGVLCLCAGVLECCACVLGCCARVLGYCACVPGCCACVAGCISLILVFTL